MEKQKKISVYAQIDFSKSSLNINTEIERCRSIIQTNERNISNSSDNSEMYRQFIDCAKQNLEYLLSLSPVE